MSLKYRIAALVFLLEIVMVGVVLWQMQARALDDGRLRLAKSERVIVSLLHELALAALITGNYATFQEFIDSVTRDSHARAVLVTDARRYVVASSDATLLGRAMPPLDDDARDYWRRAAVTGASGDLGEVAVRFSAEELLAAADAQTMFGLRLALAGMFVIACAGIIAGHVLTRRLE